MCPLAGGALVGPSKGTPSRDGFRKAIDSPTTTTINTTGTATTGALTAATVASQGNVTIRGNATTASKLVLNDRDNTNYVAFKAPDVLSSQLTWELPPTNGSAGQVLSTNGAGTLSWVSSVAPSGAASGDLTGSFPGPALAAVGTAGDYTKVTTDTKGRVIGGATLTPSDLPPISATSLTTGTLAVANGGTGVSAFTNNGVVIGSSAALSTTAAGSQYNILTVNASNQPTFGTVNLASANAVNGVLGITNGGTGASTKSGAFDALSPMTTSGDLIFGGTSGSGTRLAGNTTTTKHFLASTGSGSAPNAPVWATLTAGDYPTMIGANGITAGTTGAVPGPAANDHGKFLRGDGTWATPVNAAGATGQIQFNNEGELTGNTNFVYAGGNVGIGTTAPSAPLQVDGLAIIGATTNRLIAGGGMPSGQKGLWINYGSQSADKVTIQAEHQGTAWRDILINPIGGNVGIGTTSPAQKLSVAGTVESTSGGFKFPDGTTQTTAAQGSTPLLIGRQSFTADGTWTRPSGATWIRVWIAGGGGGGAGSNGTGNGGGGGGAAVVCIKDMSVTSISSAAVTVGAGGPNGGTNTAGGNGGSSSFGAYLTANGGTGGTSGTSGTGGAGGATSDPACTAGEDGGSKSSSSGGSAGKVTDVDWLWSYGKGGGGGSFNTMINWPGGSGNDGVVVVWAFQ